jgi:hypothetical protein
MKTTFFAALAVLGAVAATPVLAMDSRSTFLHAETGYQVTSTTSFTGAMMVRGVHKDTGKTFAVRVSPAGRVTGSFEGQPVNFVADLSKSAKVIITAMNSR